MLQLHLLPVFTGRAVGVSAPIPTVCTTPLAVLGVPEEREAEQDACPPPEARSHSLKYQLCALHAVLTHRVMLHAALHEGEHKCYLAALLCGQKPLGSSRAGALSAILAKSNCKYESVSSFAQVLLLRELSMLSLGQNSYVVGKNPKHPW